MTSENTRQHNRIVIMAGGTGGHIFPGIAVAQYLQHQGWDIHWLGTPDHMEADIVPKHGYPIHFIEMSGLRGRGIVAKLGSLWRLFKALIAARNLLKTVSPDVVLGMGGYASAAGGLAARWLNIPVVIHEQNAVVGMTNRWLSRVATKVLLGFEAAKHGIPCSSKIEVTGNPVRKAISQLPQKQPLPEKQGLNLLIIGGSLGARPFNLELPEIFANVPELHIRHQSGKGNSQAVETLYRQHALNDAEVVDFIDDMSAAYQWADVVICRAGAITVTEVSLAGIAAIFVPLPHAVDDHQTANAMSLVDRRAGYIVPQPKMAEQLPPLLLKLMADPQHIQSIRLNALDCAIVDATERVSSTCKAVANERTRKVSSGVVV